MENYAPPHESTESFGILLKVVPHKLTDEYEYTALPRLHPEIHRINKDLGNALVG